MVIDSLGPWGWGLDIIATPIFSVSSTAFPVPCLYLVNSHFHMFLLPNSSIRALCKEGYMASSCKMG